MAEGTHIPKVFISYSHDDQDHKRWVAEFASALRNKGVEVHFDQWDLGPGDDIAMYMEQSVRGADRVLMICTEQYVHKADGGKGGVGFEAMIVTGELVRDLGTSKFIPILRQTAGNNLLPISLSTRFYVDLGKPDKYEEQFETLLRELHKMPAEEKPPLGKNPFTISHSALESPINPNLYTMQESHDKPYLMSKYDTFKAVKGRVPRYAPVTNITLCFSITGLTGDTTIQDMKKIIKTIEDIMNDIFYDSYNWNEKNKHNHLIMIPTGDGYAIGFNPDDFSCQQVLDISIKLFQEITKIGIKIRIGIAKGLNIRHLDLNEKNNIFGYGINCASCVTSSAKENQILVHGDFAKEVLRDKSIEWLHDLGEIETTHGQRIRIFNYFKDGDFGRN